MFEGEGVFIDFIGVILVVLVFNIVLNEGVVFIGLFRDLVVCLGMGIIIGGIGGWLFGFSLKRVKFFFEELVNLVVLVVLWGMFGLVEVVGSEFGLMVIVVVGIVVGVVEILEL